MNGFEAGETAGGDAPILIFDAAIGQEVLTRHLREDGRLYLEAGAEEDDALPPFLAIWLKGGPAPADGFALALTSRAAYGIDLALAVVEAVTSRAGSPFPPTGIRAALQEAISNALLHGNLGLGSWDRPEDILAVGMRIGERLADPAYADRRIIITARWNQAEINLTVTDEGGGFDPAQARPGAANATCGRGLSIIASGTSAFRYADDGRTIAMSFERRMVRAGFQRSRQHLEQALTGSRVLVIDDSIANRHLIEVMLEDMGLGRMEFAEDGITGLAAVERFRPDLVLLDLNMPRMGGEEMLRRLRADPRHRDLPVIIQTAIDDQQTRGLLFETGATDFVGKPLHFDELIGRVRVHLHNRLLLGGLETHLQRIESELEEASRMQRGLLPSAELIGGIHEHHGINIDSYFETSSELGGDLWGCRLVPGGIWIYLFDVTGHGVSAALISSRLHAMIERLEVGAESDPGEFLGRLNTACCQLFPRGRFATMTIAAIDLENHSLTFASAGHPGPVIGNSSNEALITLDGSGIPLGIRPGTAYPNQIRSWHQGGFFFLYSDGLSESRGADGQMIDGGGITRMVDQVRREKRPLAAIMSKIGAIAALPPEDDMTAIWVSLNHPKAG